MRTLLLLLSLLGAMPAFSCVQAFRLDPPLIFVDERAEAVVSGLCGSTSVPFQPLVRVEGTTVIIDFEREPVGLAVPTSWGDRVRLPRLFAGEYQVVVQIMGEEYARQTVVVRDRPFRITPAFGDEGEIVMIEGVPVRACEDVSCDGLAVRFGSTPSPQVRIGNDGEILAMVPPGSGVVDITVETPEPATYVLPQGFSHGPVLEDAF